MNTDGRIDSADQDAVLIHDLARDILLAHQDMLDIKHAYSPCQASDFGHLDLDWYAANMRLLQDVNFRDLGCLFDHIKTPAEPAPRFFNQLALSGDGLIYADLAHTTQRRRERFDTLRETLHWERDRKAVNFHSEFSDGMHLMTGTAHKWNTTPGIMVRYPLPGMQMLQVLEYHIEQVESYLGANPETGAVAFCDLNEVIASDRRFEQKIVEARQKRHRLSEISIVEMGYPENISGLIMAEIRRLPVVQI